MLLPVGGNPLAAGARPRQGGRLFDAAERPCPGGVPALPARDDPDSPGGRRRRERSSAGSSPISGPGRSGGPRGGERPDAQDRFFLPTHRNDLRPKGVPVDYRKFLPNAARSAQELGIDETSVLLSAAPFTHLYGLFSASRARRGCGHRAAGGLYAGGLCACARSRSSHGPLRGACAPGGLSRRRTAHERTPATVRFVLISGSPCPPDLAQAVQERMPNGEVLQLWGMSELQAGSFTRPGDEPRVRFGTAGRASPGTELRVC